MRYYLERYGCVAVCLIGLSGCAGVKYVAAEFGVPIADEPRAGPAPDVVPAAGARQPEALDTSTAAERAAATSAAAVGTRVGETVASLGSPAQAGFWLKTPLVSVQRQGRVRDPRSGTAVAVTLIPIDGPPTAGSRLSLSAMRALGVPLGDLITLEVQG